MSRDRFFGWQGNQMCGCNKCEVNMVKPMNAKCECKYDTKMPIMPMMEKTCGYQNPNMMQGISIIRD